MKKYVLGVYANSKLHLRDPNNRNKTACGFEISREVDTNPNEIDSIADQLVKAGGIDVRCKVCKHLRNQNSKTISK